MFGLVASGRLIDTNAQQVDANKFVFPLLEPQLVNHVVVLLLGTVPLDPGFGAAVYLCSGAPEPSWQYLGFISNEKPSAIFKLKHAKALADPSANPFGFMGFQPATHAQIGLSIEPLSTLMQQQMPGSDAAAQPSDFVFFTQKMLESFYNFSTSFAMSQQQAVMSPQEQYVPMSVLQKWHDKFLQKLSQDPNFWKA